MAAVRRQDGDTIKYIYIAHIFAMVNYGMVGCGYQIMVCCGMVWFGVVSCSILWCGIVWYSGIVWYGGIVWHGRMVWLVEVA